jgi:hypothetical protein|tara:strand:+ start:2351 stop:2569 length:219 start_codon:yes stop_codon:yes gene_type:complete
VATGAANSWVIRCEKASGAESRLASIKTCTSLADSCVFDDSPVVYSIGFVGIAISMHHRSANISPHIYHYQR